MSLSDRKFENRVLFFSHLEVIYGGQYNAFWLESTDLFVGGIWLMSLLDKRFLFVNKSCL